MRTPLNIVMEALDQLTPKEREQVRQKIAFLRVHGSATPAKETASDDVDALEILNIICEVLETMGVEFTPFFLLRGSNVFKSMADKVPSLHKFLSGLLRNEKRALLRLGVRLLYENLAGMEDVVTARTIMSQVHRIPAVINQSFPDYAQAGVLSVLVRKVGSHQ